LGPDPTGAKEEALLSTAGSFLRLPVAAGRSLGLRPTDRGMQNDAGGILNVGNVESLSIATAACLYLLEGRKRRQRENMEAMKVILVT
jgi:hypothetical protein